MFSFSGIPIWLRQTARLHPGSRSATALRPGRSAPARPRASAGLLATFFGLALLACGGGESDNGEAMDSESENASAEAQTRAAQDGEARPALVFLGDSLTAGYRLAAEEAAPALIQKKLDAAGYEYKVINAGRSGDTTAGGLARLDWYLRPKIQPEAIVIGLGSNDAMRGQPITEIEANLKRIVDRIREYDESIQIFLFQMYTFPNMGPQYARDYQKLFERVAREKNITLLPFPLQQVAGKPELNQPDGIHPTAEGTKLVAESIWSALAKRLEKAPES